MNSPEEWRWIWLVGAFLFALGEMGSPGSFFLLPFAVGALVAALLAFAGVGLAAQWIAFIGIAAASLVALRPVARRLDRADDDRGIGSRRLIGQSAVVLEAIPGQHELGMVRVHREIWRAESLDGSPISSGTLVKVAEIEGTRVLVLPADQIAPPSEGVDS